MPQAISFTRHMKLYELKPGYAGMGRRLFNCLHKGLKRSRQDKWFRTIWFGLLRGILSSVTALYSMVPGSIPDGSSGFLDDFSLKRA